MSDFVVHKGQRAAGTFARHYGADVIELHFEANKLTVAVLADGRIGVGSCLGCGSAPCIEKLDCELTLFGVLDAFPGDPCLDVCPTRAIRWDGENSSAFVVESDCIGCGLCVSRCPYGAISLTDGRVASVETGDPDRLCIAGTTQSPHPIVERKGAIATTNASAVMNLPATVGALGDVRTTLLVRNLLNEVGLKVRTRRRGDTNIRIDALGLSQNNKPFVAEIETGVGVLESPRALLEDVAVLHSRYGYAVSEIDPVSIILSFPNVRSEYYQVIRDIEKVLGLRCRTITVGALVTILWNCAKLQEFAGDAFAIGEGSIDIADDLSFSGTAKPTEPYSGAFRPAK